MPRLLELWARCWPVTEHGFSSWIRLVSAKTKPRCFADVPSSSKACKSYQTSRIPQIMWDSSSHWTFLIHHFRSLGFTVACQVSTLSASDLPGGCKVGVVKARGVSERVPFRGHVKALRLQNQHECVWMYQYRRTVGDVLMEFQGMLGASKILQFAPAQEEWGSMTTSGCKACKAYSSFVIAG